MMSEDRGNAVGAMRSSTSCGMLMRASAAWALSPVGVCAGVPGRAGAGAATRREHMRPDRFVLVADRNRNLHGRLEAAPHIEPLRRAANEDRDRLERKLCLACGLGGVRPPG